MRRKLVLKRTKPTSVFCQRKQQRCYSSRQKKPIVVLREYRKQAVKLVNRQKEEKKQHHHLHKNALTTCVPTATFETTPCPDVQAVNETLCYKPGRIRAPTPVCLQEIPIAVADSHWCTKPTGWALKALLKQIEMKENKTKKGELMRRNSTEIPFAIQLGHLLPTSVKSAGKLLLHLVASFLCSLPCLFCMLQSAK